jgi:hypothetical protein
MIGRPARSGCATGGCPTDRRGTEGGPFTGADVDLKVDRYKRRGTKEQAVCPEKMGAGLFSPILLERTQMSQAGSFQCKWFAYYGCDANAGSIGKSVRLRASAHYE